MKKNLLLSIVLLITCSLMAVHDFTINGGDDITVSIGDSLHFDFIFESIGNAADFDLSISLLGQEIPLFSGNYMIFQDGGMLDETGLDGIFSGGINNFVQFPEGTTLVITLTDDEVSDAVSIQFEQLDTDFSISGTVTQEGGWIDLPVMGALVWSVYNGSMELLMELFENFDPETFMAFISSDHYILSDITGLLGTYQIFIPEDIPDVFCSVGVYSALDMNGEYVAPDAQEVTVNGHLAGIDFFYADPDGVFSGIVLNEDGEPISDAAFIMENPNSMIPWMFTVDEDGSFNIALVDGTYSYTVAALEYNTYTDSVTISGNDVYQEIILIASGSSDDALFYGLVQGEAGEPVVNAEIMIIPVDPAGASQYIYTMADGTFEISLSTGAYSYLVQHDWYEGIAGEFDIDGEDLYMEMILEPVQDNDEELCEVTEVKCYPNPFNPVINIRFSLSKNIDTELTIYNVRGELVKRIIHEELSAGNHLYQWQGTADDGNQVSSGIYYYKLHTGMNQQQGKLLLLK